ncbi:hypothetical protein [Sorangium sp. So ce1097]|uniref:hypothetical protein n=1 Tax=Sorangium sp. So ce1097 TaxID=3133330 RepID=UPI003F5F93C3
MEGPLRAAAAAVSSSSKDVAPFTDVAALRQAQRELDRRVIASCEQLSGDATLDAEVQIQRDAELREPGLPVR